MHGNQQPNGEGQGRGGLAFLMLLMRGGACSLEVFLHKSATFGERYLGAQVGAALLLMFVFPIFMPTENPEPLWYFLCAFALICMGIRSAVLTRRRKGILGPHSFYTGSPWLAPRLKETHVKGALEPVLTFLVGAVVNEFSPMLGTYLMWAAGCLLVSVQLTLAVERKRVLDMHDAFMEQRRTAEEWRSMNRD